MRGKEREHPILVHRGHCGTEGLVDRPDNHITPVMLGIRVPTCFRKGSSGGGGKGEG